MAITVSYLDAPTNVQATLQSGGSLLPNTTYYIRVVAKNFSNHVCLVSLDLLSRPSIEISFTTTDTEKSALISWDAVAGAVAYDVYMSKVSDDYANTSYNVGHWVKPNVNYYYTTLTTSYLITADTTLVSGTGANHPIGQYAFEPYYGMYFGGLVCKNLAVIRVTLSGACGKVTLQNIVDAITAAGFSDCVLFNHPVFSLSGEIYVESGTTGYICTSSSQTQPGLWEVSFWTLMAINNCSTSFDWIFGNYPATNATISYECYYYVGQYWASMQNLKFYGGIISGAYQALYPLGLAFEVRSNINTSTFIEVSFKNMRITNLFAAFNGNKIHITDLNRLWYYGDVYDVTFDTVQSFSIYPRNGTKTLHNCTVLWGNTTPNAPLFVVSGYNGYDYSGSIVRFYDTVIRKVITSWNDVIISWQHVGGRLPPLMVYFSFNIEVTKKDGTPISGALVEIYDNTDTLVASASTGGDGTITPQNIVFYKFESTGIDGTATIKTTYFPFTVKISKSGYLTYENIVDTDGKVNWHISLNEPIYINDVIEAELTDDVIEAELTGSIEVIELTGTID